MKIVVWLVCLNTGILVVSHYVLRGFNFKNHMLTVALMEKRIKMKMIKSYGRRNVLEMRYIFLILINGKKACGAEISLNRSSGIKY